jgi:hypothetical protein
MTLKKQYPNIYNSFVSMHTRCYSANLSEKLISSHRGRGIKVCEEWYKNFQAFLDWSLSNGWAKGLTIDRRDNDGDYSPDNCRWVDTYTQAANQRPLKSNNTSGYRGVTFIKSSNTWLAYIQHRKVKTSIGYFKTAYEAHLAYNKYVIDNNLPHAIVTTHI